MTHDAGQLLIASPHLGDQNFRQTVVLLIESSDEGTLGLILNRDSDRPITELWEAVFQHGCSSRQTLRVGGPVFGPLMALHTQRSLAELEVFPGLYFSTDKNHLEVLVEENLEPYNLFVGNAGWGRQQLAGEIDQGAWLLLPATRELVFSDPTDLWKQTLQLAGSRILSDILQRPLPDDPVAN